MNMVGGLVPVMPPSLHLRPPSLSPPSPHPSPPPGVDDDSSHDYNLWFIGVMIYTLATIFQALGANMQRLSANLKRLSDLGYPTSMDPARLMSTGLFVFAAGGIIGSISLIFASESLIAPLILLLFLWNPIFASLINDEPFSFRTDGVCTLLVMVGIALVEGYVPHDSGTYKTQHIEWLFRQMSFIGFLVFLVSFIASVWYLQRRWEGRVLLYSEEAHAPIAEAPAQAKAAVLLEQPAGGGEKGEVARAPVEYLPRNSAVSHFVHLSYGTLAGAMGGLNVTFTKTIFDTIVANWNRGSDSGEGWTKGMKLIFSYWLTYLLGAIVIVTYIVELKLTAYGLSRVHAMIFLPTFAVVEQVSVTMGGMLFFQDYRDFETHQALLFTFGNLLAIVAVVAMAYLRLQTKAITEASALLGGRAVSG